MRTRDVCLRLYNTLSRQVEDFKPIDPARVRLYACGPTVYDRIHIGNGRMMVVFDGLYRLLRHIYGEEHVIYVRNITDIDDKIIERATEQKIDITAFTQDMIEAFGHDVRALGTLSPTVEPLATEHVAGMISIISTLIENNHAYEQGDHVLFDITSMPSYGALSGCSPEALQAGARVQVADYKRHPGDFVLWKPSSPQQPGWDSPWGRGRPGWHIECSVMAEAYLGETFDIHGGGQDLIFPHHENELAQSRGAYGVEKMANIWMHNGFLLSEGQKMSKSLGNFYTVRELRDVFSGAALRWVLLSAHYRQPLDFSKARVAEAQRTIDRIARLIGETGKADKPPPARASVMPAPSLLDALMDDFNTPKAMATLAAQMAQIKQAAAEQKADLIASLRAGLELLGINPFERPPARLGTEKSLPSETVDQMINARNQARASADYAAADAIREELEQAGIALHDAPDGTTWSRL
ncbi:MAG: cysteine--tRNA ligase [Pseudomonadota bacterium]